MCFTSLSLYLSGSNVDEKMNQTKRVAPSPGPLIECACYPQDKCEGSKDHCFTHYGVSFHLSKF